jgi:hypothetical protein
VCFALQYICYRPVNSHQQHKPEAGCVPLSLSRLALLGIPYDIFQSKTKKSGDKIPPCLRQFLDRKTLRQMFTYTNFTIYFIANKHNKTLLPHSQLNLMCIYCTRTLTTCFGFNEPSSSEFHIQYTKLQAKCYKLHKYLKLVLKHNKIYKINSIETKSIGIARINTQF